MRRIIVTLLLITLAGCTYRSPSVVEDIPLSTQTADQTENVTGRSISTDEPGASATTTTEKNILPSQTIEPTATFTPAVVVNEINPLTGLPADNPALLTYAPALVSVSNFPISVRPQSGLSFAPHVYELAIGDGETRFLAVFYGNYGPQDAQAVRLGSIRSGRLPFEELRTMYDGFIIMAGAAPEVYSQLTATTFQDKLSFSIIQDLAEERTAHKGLPEFGPMTFDPAIQPQGVEGDALEIQWNYLNRVRWTYDPAKGCYLREQDHADGSGKFYPATDKLTGEQLCFENVVMLAAEHDYVEKYIIEMNLLYVIREPAVFFRDGQTYRVNWTSLSPPGPIRFMYEDGSAFAYKPGQVFYEIIDSIYEVQQKEDGTWFVRFINP